MEAKSASALPEEPGRWQYEPKWDGFRCLAYKSGDAIDLRAKSGKPLGRYFPEVVEMLRGVDEPAFVLDGELVVEIGGAPSFDALQMRLHPAASRINRLAGETPARFILFDLLGDANGAATWQLPLARRRELLEAFEARHRIAKRLVISPCTRTLRTAAGWLAGAGHGQTDGVVAKPLDEPYQPGKRAMVKVKRLRTADCVVGGFRYLERTPLVGSLLLGLYDGEGLLNHVGFTSSISNDAREALTRRLEKLKEPPGFTGDAPGGPSRWSTERSAAWVPLRPELVVEVRYDHVTGGRFRHGTTFMRWRPDKAPRQCTCEQIGALAKVTD